jgi:hypothetical protein
MSAGMNMLRSIWQMFTIHVAVFAILLVAGILFSQYVLPDRYSAAEVLKPVALLFVLYLAVFSLVQWGATRHQKGRRK